MKKQNIISRAFNVFEIIQSKNQYPTIYWLHYLFATLILFLNIKVDNGYVIYAFQINPFNFSTYFTEEALLSCTLVLCFLEVIFLMVLVSKIQNSSIRNSNFYKFLIKTIFFLGLFNYTFISNFIINFNNQAYKIVGSLISIIIFFINFNTFNFSLGSKRIWSFNMFFFLDIFHKVMAIVNGNKIMLILCCAIYLFTALLTIYFRPFIHLSRHNDKALIIIALDLYFVLAMTLEIMTSDSFFFNIFYGILFSLGLIFVIYSLQKKWLHYKISNILLNKDLKQTKIKDDNEHLIVLLFVQQNLKQFRNLAKQYLINHSRTCDDIKDCLCTKMLSLITGNNIQEMTQQTKSSFEIQNSSIEKNKLFDSLFSKFLANLLNKQLFQSKQVSDENKKNSKNGQTKITNVKKQQEYYKTIDIRFQSIIILMNAKQNFFNNSYLNLIRIQFQLGSYDLYSDRNSGILNFLKSQIIEKKKISLEAGENNTNKFCIKYFHSQKVTNKLQEVILKAVNEAKQFWKEVRIKEPDTHKILSIMSRFNKHHDKVMEIYSQVEHDKERQTMEVRMLFKFYERILQLEGNARFFKDSPLTDDKVNDLKNANALNLKLYSDESNTQVMSFSINEEDFGKIRYRSSSFQSLIDPSFVNINDFLLQDCVGSHNRAVKRFLEEDNNYYKHTETSPCYIRVSDKVIKPVYLEVHLMTSWTLNEIEMAAFLKPLIDDERLMEKGTCRNFKNTVEQSKVVVLDEKGAFMAYTKSFQRENKQIITQAIQTNLITRQLIKKITQTKKQIVSTTDSVFQLELIKTIEVCSAKKNYFVIFQQILNGEDSGDKTSQDNEKSVRNSLIEFQTKEIQKLNLETVLIQALKQKLEEVEDYDKQKCQINAVYQITSHPQKHGFKSHWKFYKFSLMTVFIAFVLAITICLLTRQTEFLKFNSFINDFTQNQVATTSAIAHLRQITISLNSNKNLDKIPAIVEHVQTLNEKMYQLIYKLSEFYDAVWNCMDVLETGQKIVKKEKAYIVVNNFVLSAITNIVETMRKDIYALKFSLLQSQIKPPYTPIQSSYLKLINNGVSFVFPSSILIRQKALVTRFVPSIKEMTDKPFFYLPIIGISVCMLLILYDVYLNRRLSSLTGRSLDVFDKLQTSLADNKLDAINQNSLQIQARHKPSQSRQFEKQKQTMRNIPSNVFKNAPHIPLAQFIYHTQNLNTNSSLNLHQNIQNECTERQLQNLDVLSIGSSPEKQISNHEIDDIKTSMFCTFDQILNPGLKQGIQVKCKYLVYLWVVLPLLLYFSHIFFISISFNKFMQTVLELRSCLSYRKQSLPLIWNYQYELSLYQGFAPLADRIIGGMDSRYNTEKKLQLQEELIKTFIYGSMEKYETAKKLIQYGNICQHLQLIGTPQPFLNRNFSQQQCQKLAQGILTKGLKQANTYIIEYFRSFVLENKSPQFYPPVKHYSLLNDKRISQFNQLLPYLMQATEYINDAFEEDFYFYIGFYQLLVMIDAPIILVISLAFFLVFIKIRQKQIYAQIGIIQSSFLLIGQKTLIFNPSLIKNQLNKKEPDEFYFLL